MKFVENTVVASLALFSFSACAFADTFTYIDHWPSGDGDETATTDFEVEMNGEDSGVNLISRSVARGDSYQAYRSNIIGNAKCTGHSECDAILSENGRVDASPELVANNRDAALIHEAAIGKIAGEQILKLRTLGLTEEEAEKAIIDGFLK